ncbi:MAG TPA: ACP S-malonyltransferase [Candidatus Kapabacteria bacterium]|nr:ACP S-malonyltransferase [Candidatus Kapabacteria bacterium]
MINGGLMKTALLCSGQGSQYVGMMKDLFDNSNKAKEIIHKADEILDFSLSEICFNGPMDVLKQTRFTQPAIFLHSAVLYELLKDKLEFDAVAGHSVGEYAALYIAGVIEFEDALRLVSLRGQLMYSAGEELPGTMFAVINLDDDKVVEVCNKLNQNDEGAVVVAANFNSPGQVVVSGSRDYLRNNINAFKEAGAKLVKELVVSGAFHSPLMKPAQLELEKAINTIEFKNAKVPVYSNVYAKPLTNADEIKNALIAQLTAPVLWTQSLRQMFSDGITRFVELGPGQVLQGLVKRTLENIEILGYDKFDDLQK